MNHHGSAHSTNACFAKTLRPQVSVFSTGENKYGHPDPSVYSRLKEYGDVFITEGADSRHRQLVAADIVGDDVEVLVAPDGKRFWVNGRPYESRSEERESSLTGDEPQCGGPKEITPEDYVDPRHGDDED